MPSACCIEAARASERAGEAPGLRRARTLRAARSTGDAPRSIDRPARQVMLGERHGSCATEGCARVLPRRARRLMSHQSHPRRVQLEVRAREMRLSPTLSEARLWQALQGSQLGVGFRRQVVIGEYIVDFLAPAERLVVEVDVAVTRGAIAPTRGASEFSSALGIACCVSRSRWSWATWPTRWRSS
jgi:hypothetical protein